MAKTHQSILNYIKRPTVRRTVGVAAVMLLASSGAFAATDELGSGICAIVTLLQGKFLFGIAVLAMLAGGAALLFGAELTDGVKKAVTIVAIVGMILSIGSLLSTAFSSMTACS